MLFLIEGEKTITIPPALLGPKLLAHIKEQFANKIDSNVRKIKVSERS